MLEMFRPSTAAVLRTALALVSFVIIGSIFLPTGKASDPKMDVGSEPSYSLHLTLSDPPVVSEPLTVTLEVTATVAVAASVITIIVPGHYTVTGGYPLGYSGSTSSERKYISWSPSLTTGVPSTILLYLTPTEASNDFETMLASAVDTDSDAPIGEASDEIWAKVGASAPAADISEVYPYSAEVDNNDIEVSENNSPVNLDVVEEEEWPIDKPLEVGFRFENDPEPEEEVDATIVFRNSIGSTVSFTRTLLLPDGWELITGAATQVITLTASQVITDVITVEPDDTEGYWSFGLDATLIGAARNYYPDYEIRQAGTLTDISGSLGQQWRELDSLGTVEEELLLTDMTERTEQVHAIRAAQVSEVNSLLSCLCEQEPSSLAGRGAFNAHIKGQVDLNVYDARGGLRGASVYQTEGARLRIEFTTQTKPLPGFAPRTILLGKLLTDNAGAFETCIWGIPPNLPIRVSTVSVDSAAAGMDPRGWQNHSIKTLAYIGDFDDGSPAFRWHSNLLLFNLEECPAFSIHVVIPLDYSGPYFSTSFIARDVGNFVSDELGVDIHVWEVTSYTPWPFDASSYGDYSLHITYGDAWHMGTLTHEYGHHAHESTSNNGSGDGRLAEGVATYFSVSIEAADQYFRGRTAGAVADWLEEYTSQGAWEDGYRGSAAYLWDMAENGLETGDYMVNCNNQRDDMDDRRIEDIWAILDDSITSLAPPWGSSSSGTFEGAWRTAHSSDPDFTMYKTIAYNHGMSNDTSACTNPTPPPPTPTPAPTPTP
jgi:hypothetical protein